MIDGHDLLDDLLYLATDKYGTETTIRIMCELDVAYTVEAIVASIAHELHWFSLSDFSGSGNTREFQEAWA